MSRRYVEPGVARHREELVEGIAQLRIPHRRRWFVLLFLPFWLTGWTAGGISAIREVARDPHLFLIVWLVGWAVGWVFAASTLAAQLAGAEVIRVMGGDLELSNGIGPVRRTWRYRGRTIANLTSCDPAAGRRARSGSLASPFFLQPGMGAARFDYGAKTVFFATGVDEPEGRAIVEWLTRRLDQAHRRRAAVIEPPG